MSPPLFWTRIQPWGAVFNIHSIALQLRINTRGVNKNCMVMTHALVNFSPWLRICSWLELRGKGMVIYVPQVREEQMVRICLYVYVCVAPPMIVGAWSMAVMLWQLHEHYY